MEINANSFYAHKNIRPLSTKEQSDYLPLTPLTPQNTMKYGKLLTVLALAGLLPLCHPPLRGLNVRDVVG